MERVREPVGLVTNALQHEQRLTATSEVDGFTSPGKIDLFEPLGQRCQRDLVLQAERLDDALGDGQLALATVDQQQLRWIGELPRPFAALVDRLIPLVDVRRQTPSQHFLHGRVIIVSRDRLDLEPTVLALVRQAVFQHDHRTDVVRALDVRHVVALDPQRRLGQLQHILQLGQRLATRVVVRCPAQPMTGELLLGIASHGLVEIALVATLRNPDLHT